MSGKPRQAVAFRTTFTPLPTMPSTYLIVGRGYNHFEMIETFANPDGLLGRAALELMKLV
jgi:hypothetical protein